jgi:capsular exopolysaccharide synthesis family protein
MDSSEEKINDHARAAGNSPSSDPDSRVEAGADSGRPWAEKKPTDIVRSAERTADATLLPEQFSGMRGPMQPVLSMHDIAELMLRYKWTILVVFVLVAAPAIAAIWTQVVPLYQARAEVRVRPIMPYLVFRTEDSGAIPLYNSYVNTQVSIISGPAVFQRVLDQPQVQQTQWYKNPPISLVERLAGNPPAPMDRLKYAFSARPRKDTEIIDVTFTDRSAGDAQLILNAVLDQYVKYIADMSDATQDKVYSQLVDQYKLLENEILGREPVIAQLRQRLGTATPEELVSGQRVRLDEAQARLAEVRQRIALLDWEIQQIGAADSNDATVDEDTEKQLRYHEDAEWRRLDGNVRGLRHAIAAGPLTPKHPDAARAAEDLAFAEESLRLREAQLDEQWRDRLKIGAGLSTEIATAAGPGYGADLLLLKRQMERAKYEEQLLDAEFKTQQKAFEDLFSSAQMLDKENSDLLHKRELFDAVRQRVDQKNMERNVPGSMEVLTRAVVPSTPYNDRRITLTAMTLVLALGLGGGVAFRRASVNGAIYAPKDMPYPMQVPFLGYIPETGAGKSTRGSRKSRDDEIQLNRSRIIEAIRVVRTALLSRLNGQGGTAILITSATSGTGKSTFTLMLGRSLAQAGKKVLLIDADLQTRTLTQQFENLPDRPGLIQSLRRGSVHEGHIFRTPTPGLSIIGVGLRNINDVVPEEIANGALKTCIGELREQYNVILLDSPAILSMADAAILSSQVDGTIMVERELVSHRADVIGALARLGAAGGRLLGTVFIGSASHETYE